MAASAATLRLLLRRWGSAPAPPSWALLQPLFPRPYSTPCSRLLPAAASAGLLDVRRTQASAAPVPHLLRLRHYSSKPSEVKQHCSIVTYLETLLHKRRIQNGQKELLKRGEMLNEAVETFEKATDLLVDNWWDNRAVAMFENELDNTWKAFVAYEKGVDDFGKAVDSSKGVPVHILEEYQTLCKKLKDSNKMSRQSLERMSSKLENLKMLMKLNNEDLSSPFETLMTLVVTAVGLGACLVLTLVIHNCAICPANILQGRQHRPCSC